MRVLYSAGAEMPGFACIAIRDHDRVCVRACMRSSSFAQRCVHCLASQNKTAAKVVCECVYVREREAGEGRKGESTSLSVFRGVVSRNFDPKEVKRVTRTPFP